MRCTGFLRCYSDFRDGLIRDAALLRDLEEHLGSCHRCARYDQAVSRGVGALRNLSEIEPSSQLRHALRARLASPQPTGPGSGAGVAPAGIAAAVLLGVAAALWVYEGMAANSERRQLAETTPEGPVVVVANPGVPFVSFEATEPRATRPLIIRTSAPKPGTDWGVITP